MPSPWLANTLSAPRFTMSLRSEVSIVVTSEGRRFTFDPTTDDSSKNTMWCLPVTVGLFCRAMLIWLASWMNRNTLVPLSNPVI